MNFKIIDKIWESFGVSDIDNADIEILTMESYIYQHKRDGYIYYDDRDVIILDKDIIKKFFIE